MEFLNYMVHTQEARLPIHKPDIHEFLTVADRAEDTATVILLYSKHLDWSVGGISVPHSIIPGKGP